MEERKGKKKISARPRTAVQQTRKNEFPAGKQNFPKSAFATSSRPPPFRPHLVCPAIQRSAARPLRKTLPRETRSPGAGGTHTRHPCPPQRRDPSGSDRRERSLRSSDCRKPVPRKDTRINGSCSRPRELPLPAARASALPPARTQAAGAARRSEQGLARLSPASSAYRKTKEEGSRPAPAINSS